VLSHYCIPHRRRGRVGPGSLGAKRRRGVHPGGRSGRPRCAPPLLPGVGRKALEPLVPGPI